MINKLESPFTSIRLFGTDKLYKVSNSKNINVIIEGHGGDEMFGGYGYNIFPYHIDKVHKFQNNINSRLIYAYNQMKNKNLILMNIYLLLTTKVYLQLMECHIMRKIFF